MSIRGAGLVGVVCALGAATGVGEAGGLIRLGDGVGNLTRYDRIAKVVTIDGATAFLTADAAVALERQLVQSGAALDKAVRAQFNVSEDASGRRVIDTIVVGRPRR